MRRPKPSPVTVLFNGGHGGTPDDPWVRQRLAEQLRTRLEAWLTGAAVTCSQTGRTLPRPAHDGKMYSLTPKGLAEKTRLAYAYLEDSLRLYRESRWALKEALEPYARSGDRRLILYGTGDAAELAYLTLRELGFELAGVVEEDGATGSFLGLPVGSPADIAPEGPELILIANFREVEARVESLVRLGIPRERMIVPIPIWRRVA